jgi:ElaB/YqjD/DUF883 family membrane-anchored ribosome-binding protein
MDETNYSYGDSTNNVGTSDTATKVRENLNDVKDKLSDTAGTLKGKMSQQAKTYGSQLTQKIDQARGKTSERLRNTSDRIQNLAMYVEEHDAKDMSEAAMRNSQELIRKHPGKSLLVGIGIGILVGRLFGMGMPHYRRSRTFD